MLDLAIYVASSPCCGVVVTGGVSRRVWTRADPIIASQGSSRHLQIRELRVLSSSHVHGGPTPRSHRRLRRGVVWCQIGTAKLELLNGETSFLRRLRRRSRRSRWGVP